MKTPSTARNQNGIVAILDALGASGYLQREIDRFIESRKVVIDLLNEKVEDLPIDEDSVTTFTFNDTIVIVLKTERQATLQEIVSFFVLLRKFMVDSLVHGILFRGAVAEGTFYAKEEANSIMGKAISDAAAWYDKADWIGVHATPRTSLVISRYLETAKAKRPYLMIDYRVPLTDGGIVEAKVVNWAKGFFAPKISPCKGNKSPRATLLELLTAHDIPRGTESKYINTLAFFDAATQDQEAKKTTKKTTKRKRRTR